MIDIETKLCPERFTINLTRIGDNLRYFRQKRGISCEIIAKGAMGATASCYSKYENAHCCPSLESALQLAHYLQITVDDLCTRDFNKDYENIEDNISFEEKLFLKNVIVKTQNQSIRWVHIKHENIEDSILEATDIKEVKDNYFNEHSGRKKGMQLNAYMTKYKTNKIILINCMLFGGKYHIANYLIRQCEEYGDIQLLTYTSAVDEETDTLLFNLYSEVADRTNLMTDNEKWFFYKTFNNEI